MSKLRDRYVSWGHKEDNLNKEVFYLRDLSLESILEVGECIRDFKGSLEHLEEFVDILDKYKLGDSPEMNLGYPFMFPCMALRKAIIKDSQKELNRYGELALEMNLMTRELKSAISSYDKLELARKILLDLNEELLFEHSKKNSRRFRRLAA